MKLQTKIHIAKADFKIRPTDNLLFVGSCFASEMGKRFADNGFKVTVNPYGTMYNPASILHTISRFEKSSDVVIITLGTNHVYILNETGEIVDNCHKRPAALFTERTLTVSECMDYLRKSIDVLLKNNPYCKVIFTVSPIRYQKYGFHESRLSKATLLLAVDELINSFKGEKDNGKPVYYFPAYEIMDDELRDYRFYKPDMLHPSEQAVDYINELFCDACISDDARLFIDEWQPIKQALSHRPFNPDSEEYKMFIEKTKKKETEFRQKWRL